MKYLGLLVILVALKWTWGIAQHPQVVDSSTHEHLQHEMERIVRDYISKARPASSNLKFDYLWTETINENQVRAHFRYSYEDVLQEGDSAEEVVAGTANLRRVSPIDQGDAWALDSVEASHNSLIFKEGLVLGPLSGESAKSSLEAPSASETPAEEDGGTLPPSESEPNL